MLFILQSIFCYLFFCGTSSSHPEPSPQLSLFYEASLSNNPDTSGSQHAVDRASAVALLSAPELSSSGVSTHLPLRTALPQHSLPDPFRFLVRSSSSSLVEVNQAII